MHHHHRQSQGSAIHDGVGAADEKDPTVIKGQESSNTAEEVQKLQKVSDPDSHDSYNAPGAQPTSPHTSCDLKSRDVGLIDALNDLSLEELKSFGLDKPFDDSKLTAEVVDRLKALRLERLAAPDGKLACLNRLQLFLCSLNSTVGSKLKGHVAHAGDHGITLPESGISKKEEDGLMDYWYDSEDDGPCEYDQDSELECEQATDESPHGEVEIATGEWVDVVADVAQAPNGIASKPCIIN